MEIISNREWSNNQLWMQVKGEMTKAKILAIISSGINLKEMAEIKEKLQEFAWYKDIIWKDNFLQEIKEIDKKLSTIAYSIKVFTQNITRDDEKTRMSDRGHKFNWWISRFSGLTELIKVAKPEELEYYISVIALTSQGIVEGLEDFAWVNVVVAEENKLANIVSVIEKQCMWKDIKVSAHIEFADQDYFINCHDKVAGSIIYELLENYRKYGKEWELKVSIENNQFIIELKNKTKEKSETDYSSGQWTIIMTNYMKLLKGKFNYGYESADNTFTATVSLPLYQKEDHS